MKTKSKLNTKKLTTTALLTAIGAILQFVEISIPIIPSFIKLDFSDLPVLIGAFTCGPSAGVIISLLKNIIHIAFGSSGAIGELSNFLLGASMAVTAGFIYKKIPNFKGMLIGGTAGALVMGIISLPLNYFIIYPLYYSVMGFPQEAILQMYQLIRPSTKNIQEALLIFNTPFTAVKGLFSVAVTALIYKPLHKLISNME
ncbi:MAG: ECF transporter S component [Clostridiales bacterium]|nr:ECF transporter S component [Clostridiales bacterium]